MFYPIKKDHELLGDTYVFGLHFSIMSLQNNKLISILLFDFHTPKIGALSIYLFHGVHI